jgi:hydrogenase maturation protein HypF
VIRKELKHIVIKKGYSILIRGLVQGVGFRPFVCRLAKFYNLNGQVDNRANGVMINVEGEEEMVLKFKDHILKDPPAASQIKSVEIEQTDITSYCNFSIGFSKSGESEITEICPDIAVCSECLDDLQNDPYRINYPFINCTNCGPRFTIVDELPYDRHKTSMKDFRMCDNCASEYNDILNRRFHAQPVACNSCGPVFTYEEQGIKIHGIDRILEAVSSRIMGGKAVAIKGLGGYHLLCNAMDDEAVKELRLRKHRDAKPFAVMFRDIFSLEEYCLVNPAEYRELISWRRPILILKQGKSLAHSVSNGLGTIGAVLPYMPVHYLLFSRLETPAVVLTSGNISDEPLIKDDDVAYESLLPIIGAIMSYNRKIVNRADDSVMRIIGNSNSLIRRSRGFVPSPVDLAFNVDGILALGAEQKNTFCIGRDKQAIMSQYIGDLKNLPTYEFFIESIERFKKLFRFKPVFLVCDLHPDYFSSVHAHNLEKDLNIPLIMVQHHHAHIASCMAEYHLDEKVIGICMDGTGYGTDGNTWGGEFMIADLKEFQRYSHFDYIPLPGGNKAVDEPWRIAFSYLYKYLRDELDYSAIPCFRFLKTEEKQLLMEMIDKKVNSPLSSGAGRLFDAVSAILGLCSVAGFDSEAPMRLESVIDSETNDHYPYEIGEAVVFAETLRSIINDLGNKKISFISSKFHNTVAEAVAEVSEKMRRETSINKVVLSGGVFQNKYLVEKLLANLKQRKFEVFTNQLVPSNDSGISLGQLIIASKIKELCV